jgi:acylphosphatase
MACRQYRVTGRVQGVFFRDSTRREADSLGLGGWVRNRRDGSVELLACGDPAALAALEKWLQSGPPQAKVANIESRVADAGGACPPPGEFSILPTL